MSETTETSAPETEAEGGIVAPPETTPEPSRAPPPQPDNRTVPLAALQEERRRRKEYEAQLLALQAQTQANTSGLREMIDAIRPKPAPPDPQSDPLGHLMHENQTLREQVAEVRRWREEQERERQQQSQFSGVLQRFNADAAEFSAVAPDFPEAYQWVSEQVRAELRASGLSADEAADEARRIGLRVVDNAARTGRNAAEAIYAMAKTRGFKAPPPAAAISNPSTLVDQMKVAQSGARTISGPAAGPKGYEGLTLAQLANMSQADYNKVPDAIRRRLLGG